MARLSAPIAQVEEPSIKQTAPPKKAATVPILARLGGNAPVEQRKVSIEAPKEKSKVSIEDRLGGNAGYAGPKQAKPLMQKHEQAIQTASTTPPPKVESKAPKSPIPRPPPQDLVPVLAKPAAHIMTLEEIKALKSKNQTSTTQSTSRLYAQSLDTPTHCEQSRRRLRHWLVMQGLCCCTVKPWGHALSCYRLDIYTVLYFSC